MLGIKQLYSGLLLKPFYIGRICEDIFWEISHVLNQNKNILVDSGNNLESACLVPPGIMLSPHANNFVLLLIFLNSLLFDFT